MPRALGIAGLGLTVLMVPAVQASSMGVNGSINVAGSVPYVVCGPPNWQGASFNQTANAPGDGPLAFSDTVSGSLSGYYDSQCTVPDSASGTFSALVAGNQLSMSGDVTGIPLGDAGGSGQLTAYDTLTFQPGTYELTAIITDNLGFSPYCDGRQEIDAQVSISNLVTTPFVALPCGSAVNGTQEFQLVFTVGQYTPPSDTLSIYAYDSLQDYPNQSTSGSVTVTAYVDALSGSFTSASGTDYSTPSGTPEPGTWELAAGGVLLAISRKIGWRR